MPAGHLVEEQLTCRGDMMVNDQAHMPFIAKLSSFLLMAQCQAGM